MKTILTFVIIAILMAGCASENSLQPEPDAEFSPGNPEITDENHDQEQPGPPFQVYIKDVDELAEMRRMLEADDDVLQRYLWDSSLNMNGVTTRENLRSVLSFIDSLPFPSVRNELFPSIKYYPEYQGVYICYELDTGEIYSFYFFPSETTLQDIYEKAGKQFPEPIFSRNEGKIKVYPSVDDVDSDTSVITFMIDIEGYTVRAGYRNNDRNVSGVSPDSIYKDLQCFSLRAISGT